MIFSKIKKNLAGGVALFYILVYPFNVWLQRGPLEPVSGFSLKVL